MRVLVTGATGFIGMHVCLRLLEREDEVMGVDNMSDYYDVALKHARLSKIQLYKNFNFKKINIDSREAMNQIFEDFKPAYVVHLAAQPGVRYSIENPHVYADSNLLGFVNILECCRHHQIDHLVYASSSSVYGGNEKLPFRESDNVDHPVSLYAATKKANELMAHTYSHLFQMPTTGLRLFTVYGPWGRPDMSPMLFVKAILSGEYLNIFNNGQMERDFTYIKDVVEAVVRVLDKPAFSDPNFDALNPSPSSSKAPYRIFNVGNSTPITLMDYIKHIEDALGIVGKKNFMPLQAGDLVKTSSDSALLKSWIGFEPKISLTEGIKDFVTWYKQYYRYS